MCFATATKHNNAKGKPMNAPAMNAPVRTLPTSTLLPTEQDPRWAAVIARDRSADGSFYYSVSTTGVYCRPSCPARHAKPSHVRFHRTRADAERAGFRACKRCKPDQLSDEPDARIASRVAAIDWAAAARSLDGYGFASLGTLLSADECAGLASCYDDGD